VTALATLTGHVAAANSRKVAYFQACEAGFLRLHLLGLFIPRHLLGFWTVSTGMGLLTKNTQARSLLLVAAA